MRHIFSLAALIVAAVAAVAADPAPELTLRINGRSAAATPLGLWRGEPVVAEVTLRHPGAAASQALRLDPPSGGWAGRVQILAADAGGRPVSLGFSVAGRPTPGALDLVPNAVTTLLLVLDPSGAAQLSPGAYRFWARLALADGRGWRGIAKTTLAIPVTVTEAPATPTGEALGRRQLLRARAALLAGDIPGAEAAARAMLLADLDRPEGYVALALIAAAKGDNAQAGRFALYSAARAMTAGQRALRPDGAKPEPPQSPVEYQDLVARFPLTVAPESAPQAERAAVAGAARSAAPAPAAAAPPSTAPVQGKAASAGGTPPPAARVATATPQPAGKPAPKPVVLPGETDYTQDPGGQWAYAAEASSQYHDTGGYSAQQATGAPNVPAYGDHSNAWISKTIDGGAEWLLLRYATPVHATEVRVRQTYNPGALIRVEVIDAAGVASEIWSGRDQTAYASNKVGWFVARFPATAQPVNAVRLSFDTASIRGWNEIDAVQLVGTAGPAVLPALPAPAPKPAATVSAGTPAAPGPSGGADALAARLLSQMTPAGPKGTPSPADLCFRHAGRALMVSPMAERFGRNPDEKRQFGEVFQQLLDATAKEFSGEGTPYDLAKAFAYFVIVNYTVLHPEAPLDEPLSDRLLEQFRTRLLDSGAGRAADDTAKQSLYETLVILGGMTVGGYQKGTEENDAGTVAAMRHLAAENLKHFLRVDAAQVRLDPDARWPLSLGGGDGGPVAPAAAAQAGPSQATVAAARPESASAQAGIVGAWWGMRTMLNGSSVQLQTEHLVFFPNGTFAFDLPRRGLENLDLDLARAEQLRIWGQYSYDGAKGVVTGISNGGEPFQLTPKGALLMLGTQYVRCLSPAGMRLDGTYIVDGLGDTELTFGPDGRFTDRGLLRLSDVIDQRPEFAEPGSGTYEIRNCSLILAYDDGRRAQVAFYLATPEDAATSRPSTIVLNKMRRARAP